MPTHYGHGEDLSEQELIDRATKAERDSIKESLEAQNKLNNERYKKVTNPQNPGDKLKPGEGIDTGELDEYGKPVYESKKEAIHWTGWPLKALQKVGEGFDWIDKQAGIGEFNVYNARRKILDPLSETHFALGILGEIFLPDTVDIATAGFTYIPNRFRKLGKVGARMWAKAASNAIPGTKRAQIIADWDDNLKGLAAVAKIEGKSLEQVLAETGQVSYMRRDLEFPDDLTEEILRLNMPKTAAPNPTTGSRGFLGTTSFDGVQYTKTTLDPEFKIPWNLVNNPKEKGRMLAGAFTDQASDPKKWHELNNAIKARMERLYPGWDIPLKSGQKPIGGWAGHHTAPVKQIAWAVNGLDNKARNAAADYISKGIGQRLGFSPENLRAIPVEFHKYVHRMLNDAMGTYDISTIEKTLGLKPGGFADLELWDRKKGFDMIIDSLLQSKKDIEVFMSNLAIQSKHTDVSPEVLVDSMEELLDLQTKIRLNPKDTTLNQIINKFLGRSQEALKFVDDELPAAERPIKNMLYALALRDKEKAIEFARAQRGNKLKLDPQTGMRPDD